MAQPIGIVPATVDALTHASSVAAILDGLAEERCEQLGHAEIIQEGKLN